MSTLNEEAKALLLQVLRANGGSIEQLDLVTALSDLVKEGKVETAFVDRRGKNYIMKYSYKLTKKGYQDLQPKEKGTHK